MSGSANKDQLLRQQIAAMPWEEFEQLVFELVRRSELQARRLTHPDGGADVIIHASDGRAALVWQAKRYTQKIDWEKCVGSLNAAVKRWKPSRVTFAFACDFSERRELAFQTRLVEPAREQGVEVDAWTLSELVQRLSECPHLKVRFFGESQTSEAAALTRMVEAGGKLETGEDLIRRAHTLAEFTEQADPKFTYHTSSRGPSTPAPNWDELPYMTMSVGDIDSRIEVSSWPREGVEVEPPAFWFESSPGGQRARLEAVKELAAGRRATIREGARLRLTAPRLFQEGLAAEGEAEATLFPGNPLLMRMLVRGKGGEVALELTLRPVPPEPGAAAAFAGYGGGVLVELSYFLEDEPNLSVRLALHGEFSPDVSTSLETARTLMAFQQQERVFLDSEELFPATGGLAGKFGGEELDERTLAELKGRLDFYEDLALIESRTSRTIMLPDRFSSEDVEVAQVIAAVLRSGIGQTTLKRVSGEVEDPSEIPRLAQHLAEAAPVRQEITARLFGDDLVLGVGEFTLPPMKVVKVVAGRGEDSSSQEVVLEADGDAVVEYRLVDAPADDSIQQADA